MLYYCEIALSPIEVPGELSICVYITGCQNRCEECHYPELQLYNYGNPLMKSIDIIVDAYIKEASCLCIMGEGQLEDRKELTAASLIGHSRGLKTCLYSGRDVDIEDWMKEFDYVKVGSYQKACGPLTSKTTNQVFYMKENNSYKNITEVFWGC